MTKREKAYIIRKENRRARRAHRFCRKRELDMKFSFFGHLDRAASALGEKSVLGSTVDGSVGQTELPTENDPPTDASTVLAIAMDVGGEILKSGGEIHRVEDTITRICYAYGAIGVEVFAITTLIIAEVRMPDGGVASCSRRVRTTYNHLARLEHLNSLSRTICACPASYDKVRRRITDIGRYRPVPEWLCYVGGMLATGGFAVFFGGTWRDGVAAALIGLLLTLFVRLRPPRINAMARTVISSFLGGVLSVLCVSIGLGDHVDKIVIGTIMLEIPGLSFGNSLRDLFCGDTLSGTLRLIQALLQALMMAFGYMAAFAVCNLELWGGLL